MRGNAACSARLPHQHLPLGSGYCFTWRRQEGRCSPEDSGSSACWGFNTPWTSPSRQSLPALIVSVPKKPCFSKTSRCIHVRSLLGDHEIQVIKKKKKKRPNKGLGIKNSHHWWILKSCTHSWIEAFHSSWYYDLYYFPDPSYTPPWKPKHQMHKRTKPEVTLENVTRAQLRIFLENFQPKILK